jgi:hypothetical protein
MRTYRGVEIQLHVMLTSALDEINAQLHVPAATSQSKATPAPFE